MDYEDDNFASVAWDREAAPASEAHSEQGGQTGERGSTSVDGPSTSEPAQSTSRPTQDINATAEVTLSDQLEVSPCLSFAVAARGARLMDASTVSGASMRAC